MADQLEWERRSEKRFEAADGWIRYSIKQSFDGRWSVSMNGASIGRGGFESARAAMEYVDWGGTPNRMGFDRETGEAQ